MKLCRLIATLLFLLFANITESSQNTSILETGTGQVAVSGFDTNGVSQYDLVYISGNSVVGKADAYIAAYDYHSAVGMYAGTGGQIIICGLITNTGWNTTTKPTWSAGKTLFLSETAGELSDSIPEHSGACLQIVGYIVDINAERAIIYIAPQLFNMEK